jgi:predicted permease
MATIGSDLRDTWRAWRRRPGFALAAVVSMGLGIGAGTATFSVVHGVLLEPLPFDDPDAIFAIHSRHTSTDRYPFQLVEFCDYRDGNRTLQSMAAYAGWNANLTGTGDAERIQGMRATANLFELLGTKAVVGRSLVPADDEPAAERVVVLSHGLWVRRFGGDTDIVGRTLTFNAESYSVAGILPADFVFPQRGAEVAVPLKPEGDAARHDRESTSFLRVLGRARPGTGREAIQADLDAIAHRLQQEHPDAYARKPGVRVVRWSEDLVAGVQQVLWVLQGTVLVLLLITCANVASLMLARAASLRGDIAVRQALGESAGGTFRRQVVEGLMLSLAGGAVGLLGAVWGVPALLALAPPDLPRRDAIGMHPTVLLFTLGVSIGAGLLATALPAWRTARGDLREDLTGSDRSFGPGRRGRARWILVSAEVTLLAVLLSTGSLLYRSFLVASRVSPGFDDDTLTVRLSLPRARYDRIEKVTAFYDALESRVAALPGVTEVAAVNHVPLNGALASADYRTPEMPTGSGAALPTATYRMATPRYFRAMGIPLLSGRAFDDRDDTDAPHVAIISQALARKSFSGKDPVGTQILVQDSPEGFRPFEIVGVVGDIRHDGLEAQPSPHLFVPYAQTHPSLLMWLTATQYLAVRASVDPRSLEPAIRKVLREVDPDVAAAQVRTTGDAMAASIAPRRFTLTLLGVFAAIATAMAAFGLHGVVSTSVAWRTREMALRMALGARPAQVRRLVLRQAAVAAAAGGACGLAVSLASSRLLEGLLFGVTAADPASHVCAFLVLGAVVLAACDAPARRAARTPLFECLKTE